MYELTVSANNLERVLNSLALLPSLINHARRSALSGVGYFASGEVRRFIEGGGTSGNPSHPLTRYLEERGGRWVKRHPEKPIAYSGLGKFARYVINGRADLLLLGFGTFGQKDASKGRFLAFSDVLQRYAREMQTGKRVVVTPAMRRKMGATKGALGDKGRFFPIRKTTTVLFSPKRSLGSVVSVIASKAPGLFSQKFAISFTKKLVQNDY